MGIFFFFEYQTLQVGTKKSVLNEKKNNSPFYVWKYWAVKKKKKKKKERNRGKPFYTELDVVYVKPVNKL